MLTCKCGQPVELGTIEFLGGKVEVLLTRTPEGNLWTVSICPVCEALLVDDHNLEICGGENEGFERLV